MIKEARICDCCGKEVEPKEFYRVKVKSDAFVNYVNFDMIGANKQTFDICQQCVSEFLDYLRWKNK